MKTGNKIAIQLKALGVEDDKGKFRMVMGWHGHQTCKPDFPLSSLLIPLIRDISALARYSSVEAAKEDGATLVEYLETFVAEDVSKKQGA